MNSVTPAPSASGVAAAISALRHHAAFAAAILRIAPLAFDPNVRPIAVQPRNPERIAEALELDKRLPSLAELDDLRVGLDDALSGPQIDPDAIGRMVPLLFAGRSIRPETIPTRLATLMEIVAFERRISHITPDVLALAVLTDLRTNRFPPEPSEFIAAIVAARRSIATVSDALEEIGNARESVDDLLVEAGVREPVDDDCDLPFDDSHPALPSRRRRNVRG